MQKKIKRLVTLAGNSTDRLHTRTYESTNNPTNLASGQNSTSRRFCSGTVESATTNSPFKLRKNERKEETQHTDARRRNILLFARALAIQISLYIMECAYELAVYVVSARPRRRLYQFRAESRALRVGWKIDGSDAANFGALREFTRRPSERASFQDRARTLVCFINICGGGRGHGFTLGRWFFAFIFRRKWFLGKNARDGMFADEKLKLSFQGDLTRRQRRIIRKYVVWGYSYNKGLV